MTISKRQHFYLRDSRDFFDAQRVVPRSRQGSDDEESAKIIPSSAPLSVLLIPSLKEVSTLLMYNFNQFDRFILQLFNVAALWTCRIDNVLHQEDLLSVGFIILAKLGIGIWCRSPRIRISYVDG